MNVYITDSTSRKVGKKLWGEIVLVAMHDLRVLMGVYLMQITLLPRDTNLLG